MTDKYEESKAEQYLDCINVYDLEEEAKKVTPKGGFGHITSAAGDSWTLKENIKAFNHKLIVPEVLQEVDSVDQRTEILGEKLSTPIIMAPTASHGLANNQAEPATAKGVAASDTIMTISSFANRPLAEISKAGGEAPQWFQFYMSPQEDISRQILDDAVENGVKAIVLTADAIVGGNREPDARNGFTYPFSMPIVKPYITGAGQSSASIGSALK